MTTRTNIKNFKNLSDINQILKILDKNPFIAFTRVEDLCQEEQIILYQLIKKHNLNIQTLSSAHIKRIQTQFIANVLSNIWTTKKKENITVQIDKELFALKNLFSHRILLLYADSTDKIDPIQLIHDFKQFDKLSFLTLKYNQEYLHPSYLRELASYKNTEHIHKNMVGTCINSLAKLCMVIKTIHAEKPSA